MFKIILLLIYNVSRRHGDNLSGSSIKMVEKDTIMALFLASINSEKLGLGLGNGRISSTRASYYS